MNQPILPGNKRLSIILLSATSIIWGTSFILIKKATLVFEAVEVGSLRVFYAFLAFIPIFFLHRKKIPKDQWGWIFVSGMMGSLLPSLLFSWAGTKISSSLSGMLNATTPLFTILAATFLFHQRFAIQKWVGLLVGLFGTLLLAIMKPNGGFEFNIYILPVLFATILYALNVNLLKTKLGNIKPIPLSAASIICVGPIATFILFGTTDFSTKIGQSEGAWGAAGYVAILGLVGTALALMLFNKLIQISGPVVASSVTYIMPVISVFWGMADGEPIGPGQIFGLIAILLGVFIINRSD